MPKSKSPTGISDMPQIPKPFSAVHEDRHASDSRDAPRPHPTTIGPSDHQATTPQSTGQPHRQDLCQNLSPVQNTLSRQLGLLREAMVLTSEEPDVQVVKRENIRKLMDRIEECEREWKSNMQKISDLKQDICQYQEELKKLKKQLCDDEIKLETKERKISQLQDDIYQKEMKLKQKQSDVEDLLATAEQLRQERVTELEMELNNARSDMQSAVKEKNDMEKQFKEVYQLITNLKTELKSAKREVTECKEKNVRLKLKLEVAEDFLNKEKQEVENLLQVVRRHKDILVTYRFILVLIITCIAGILLQNMGVLPWVCSVMS